MVVYDTFTEYISDDDLVNDFLDVDLDEITKKKVNKWCSNNNAIVLSFGKYAFKYFDNDVAKIKIIGYHMIPGDILDSKEEHKEQINQKIDKEIINSLQKVKNYCKTKKHCYQCDFGCEIDNEFKCNFREAPEFWDLGRIKRGIK